MDFCSSPQAHGAEVGATERPAGEGSAEKTIWNPAAVDHSPKGSMIL